MRTRFTWTDVVIGLVWLFPLGYLAGTYAELPEKVAIHFDLHGQPNDWGPRRELLIVVIVLSAVSLGAALLIRFLPRVDPKRKASSGSILGKISYAMVFLLSGLTLLMIQSGLKGRMAVDGRLLDAFIALFMAFLGNQMNSLKANYFVGVRTPWTLENDTVWKKTHQMTGRLWLVGGLLIAVLCLVLPDKASLEVFLGGLILLTLVPVVYSYLLYRQIQKQS